MNSTSKPKLIPASYLFRLSLPLYYRETIWKKGITLEPRYEIPQFQTLDQDQARENPLSTCIAWSEEGLTFQFTVSGKKQKPHCRITDLEQSDSIEIFVDTRNTKTVHRATRFCHRFLFLPSGGGVNGKEPYGSMLKIRLARGEPTAIGQFQPQVVCQNKRNGYQLSCHLPKKFLEGWQPQEQPEIGFYFLLRDQELGVVSMTYDAALPVNEDPSLWPTAFLAKNTGV